jgi:hypothetical protein
MMMGMSWVDGGWVLDRSTWEFIPRLIGSNLVQQVDGMNIQVFATTPNLKGRIFAACLGRIRIEDGFVRL